MPRSSTVRGILALGVLAAPAGDAAGTQRLIVRGDDTLLLERCGNPATVRTRLPAGHEVSLRYAIAGTSHRCYAVWTRLGGETFSGYVERDALEGADKFEQTLREASAARLVEETIRTIRIPNISDSAEPPMDPPAVQDAVRLAIVELQAGRPSHVDRILANARPPSQSRDAALLRAQALLQLTRPTDALNVIRPALEGHLRDPDLLAVAGLSAYLADEPNEARSYLRHSLALASNEAVAGILSKLEQEVEADGNTNMAYGTRFVLRYERGRLPPPTSRRLIELFESEATRISAELGCPLPSRLPVIVQSVENFRSATGSAEWSAGHYDGRIRIAVPVQADAVPHVREVFAHEYVHACLARVARWPTWFHEGMAQRYSGTMLERTQRMRLGDLARNGNLPSLDELGGDWTGLDTEEAAVAYALSLAAVNLLFEKLHPAGIRNLIINPEKLAGHSEALQRTMAAAL